MSPANAPIIELENVSRTYDVGGSLLTALDSVTLHVPYGQFIVVLGPSGSGKTTLVNIMGALDSASSGTVTIRVRRRGSNFQSRARKANAAATRIDVS